MEKFRKFKNISQIEKNVKLVEKKKSERTAKSNENIQFKINEKDDEMVTALKQEINRRSISMQELYNTITPSEAYNLYYGLLKRNSITLVTFKKWCEILDVEFEIKIL